MTSSSKFSAQEAADAVNALLRMDSQSDEEALQEVISNYFCPPNHCHDSSDDDSDSDLEEPIAMEETGD